MFILWRIWQYPFDKECGKLTRISRGWSCQGTGKEKKSENKIKPLNAINSKKREREPENLDETFEYYEELKRDFADAKKKEIWPRQ